jgi:alpha-glucoside transport system substrate-binding protein
MLGLGAVAAVAAVALTGCTGGGGANTNRTVTIMGAFTDAQAKAFQADLDAWSKSSGVKVKYSGSTDFQTAIVAKAAAGNPPDIAIFPQPGVLAGQEKTLYPLEDLGIDVKSVTSDEAHGLGDIATSGGKTFGLPYSINVKSLVWYNPAAFSKAGLTVPKTEADLTALAKTITDHNLGYPWCVGIESGAATGWPATDWLEEYVLRDSGLDTYNKWVTGAVKFSDAPVKAAGQKVATMLLASGQVNGGGPAAATTSFQTAGNQLFADGKDKGQCFMMKQGSFIADFFPDNIKAEIAKGDTSQVNFFQVPGAPGAQNSMEGGGDLVGAYSKDSDTEKVVNYLVSKDFGTHGYASQAIFLSPHNTFDVTKYTSVLQKNAQALLKNSTVFGFDASDQMPAQVGSGTEWKFLTQWFAGQITMDNAFQQIDASWPAK